MINVYHTRIELLGWIYKILFKITFKTLSNWLFGSKFSPKKILEQSVFKLEFFKHLSVMSEFFSV